MNSEDLNILLDVALSKGCDELEKQGFVHPFAISLGRDGEIQVSGEFKAAELSGDPEHFLAELHATLALSCAAGKYRGTAVGCQVKVVRFKNEGAVTAIEVLIEHQDGTAVDCFLPFKMTAGGKPTYGSVWSIAAENRKFIKN
ncbi:MAG: hypothetical protein RL095_2793 [Verrucomicrobiota bacterium]|jgi:hypothetical protein